MTRAKALYDAGRRDRWLRGSKERRDRGDAVISQVETIAGHWSDRDEHRLWAQRVHAARRAEQRYGVLLDARALRLMSDGMRDTLTKPGLMYIGRAQEGRRTAFWLVVVDRVEMLALYDEDTRQIATFLPMDATQVAFDGGRFYNLANGGSRQARAYWSAR